MKSSDRAVAEAGNASAELLDVAAVGALLGGVSQRTIYRWSDAGRMPRPLKLGALTRWRRDDVTAWIAGGCEPVR